jgi:[ribosomal protein S18]-alanine N-acetyltransferase
MSQVTLREYRTGDWESMYALDMLCFEPPFRFSRQTMRKFTEAPNAITVLAEAEGSLAGFCVSHVEEQVAYMVTVDVAREWRRLGVATKLIAATETCARAIGVESVALHVFTGNAGAIGFYETLAYVRRGVAEEFYGRGLNAFVYIKQLDQKTAEGIYS